MILKNKKTGEMVAFGEGIVDLARIGCRNVGEMIEAGWEDYEEPAVFYWIDYDGKICKAETGTMDRSKIKQLGNYFETKEEAELAVEKLKALKRLKDKGLKFNRWKEAPLRTGSSCVAITGVMNVDEEAKTDLDLLFGGEE